MPRIIVEVPVRKRAKNNIEDVGLRALPETGLKRANRPPAGSHATYRRKFGRQGKANQPAG